MRHFLPPSRGHVVVPARSQGLAVVIGAGLLLPACGGEDGAENGADERVAVDPNGVPRISFVTLSHDFGSLPDTKPVRTSFGFSNTGTGKLVITDVKANCRCTAPTLEKMELLPGEGSAIDVIFDPAGRAGELAKHIKLVSNAQPDAVTTLTISAHVEPTVRVDTQILNLGDLRLGRENRTYFNVYYRNPRVEITRIEVDNPHLTARLAGPRTESPVNEQGEYSATIEVVVDKDAPWGVIDRANLTFDQALKVHAIPRGSYASPRPAEGWWLLTRGAADALDMGDRIGSLEPGYQADCLVVRPEGWIAGLAPEQQISALLYTLRPQQIEHVYIAGRRVGP